MTKTVYRASSGAQYNDQAAQALGEWVESKGGKVCPEDMVEEARPERSSLHGFFPWDDAVAAAAYRVDLARRHLNHLEIVIVKDGKEVETRAVHNLIITGQDGEKERGYFSYFTIRKSPLLREQVVEQALRELIAWKQRYSQYKELFGVAKAIDKAIDSSLNGQPRPGVDRPGKARLGPAGPGVAR